MAKPRKPGVPTVTKDPVTRRIVVTSKQPSGTSGVTSYQMRRRSRVLSGRNTSSKWSRHSTHTMSARKYSMVFHEINIEFEFETRAKNKDGWGPWSDVKYFHSQDPTMWLKYNGEWRPALVFVKLYGEWRPALAHLKHEGNWRKTGV